MTIVAVRSAVAMRTASMQQHLHTPHHTAAACTRLKEVPSETTAAAILLPKASVHQVPAAARQQLRITHEKHRCAATGGGRLDMVAAVQARQATGAAATICSPSFLSGSPPCMA